MPSTRNYGRAGAIHQERFRPRGESGCIHPLAMASNWKYVEGGGGVFMEGAV